MLNLSRLKDIREDNDMSQVEISRLLKVNRSTYSLWELEINIMPLKLLNEFADNFNVSLDYLLGIINTKNSDKIAKGFDVKILGKKMRQIRLKNDLSQDNIASILGVTQACIAKYEKGIICISTSNLYKFANEFNLSIDWLCGKRK